MAELWYITVIPQAGAFDVGDHMKGFPLRKQEKKKEHNIAQVEAYKSLRDLKHHPRTCIICVKITMGMCICQCAMCLCICQCAMCLCIYKEAIPYMQLTFLPTCTICQHSNIVWWFCGYVVSDLVFCKVYATAVRYTTGGVLQWFSIPLQLYSKHCNHNVVNTGGF